MNDMKSQYIDELRRLSDKWYASQDNLETCERIAEAYNAVLQRLFNEGWNYSLYIVNEIPYNYIPDYYKKNSFYICDSIINILKEIAFDRIENMRAGVTSKQDFGIINKYRKYSKELFKISHESIINKNANMIPFEYWMPKDGEMPDFYENEWIDNGINIFDRQHEIDILGARRVRTIGLSQIADGKEEWY